MPKYELFVAFIVEADSVQEAADKLWPKIKYVQGVDDTIAYEDDAVIVPIKMHKDPNID